MILRKYQLLLPRKYYSGHNLHSGHNLYFYSDWIPQIVPSLGGDELSMKELMPLLKALGMEPKTKMQQEKLGAIIEQAPT